MLQLRVFGSVQAMGDVADRLEEIPGSRHVLIALRTWSSELTPSSQALAGGRLGVSMGNDAAQVPGVRLLRTCHHP